MKILYVTYGLPVPPSSGARLRDFHLIRRVARHHEVYVLSLLEPQDDLRRTAEAGSFCAQVDGVAADRGPVGSSLMAIRGLLRGRPAATATYYYPALARRIRELTRQHRFDLVQFEHSFLAPYRTALDPDFDGATVLSLHNLGQHQYDSIYRMSSGFQRLVAAGKAGLMRGWESRLAADFDHVIVVSSQDRERLRREAEGINATVIGNGVDCGELQAQAPVDDESEDLLFVGTLGYPPNEDAVRWFCAEILPRIRDRRPACRLIVAGAGGHERVRDLHVPGRIEIIGRFTDPRPLYARARLAVVPLRSGGGSRLKILEAMALGRPVVSTALGREGLDLVPGHDLIEADQPDHFADAVCDLLENPRRAQDLATTARNTVERHHDWNLLAHRLLEVYDQWVPERPRSSVHDVTQTQRRPRSDGPPRLSVIIPVYNMREDLERCLDALAQSSLADHESIVVDDGSDDGSAEVAASRCDRLIRLDRNRGQSEARNRGAREARAPLLFFLDADVLVEPETLDRLLEVFQQHADLAAMFCSYQHDTPAGNFSSQYKNLQHHYTHQVSRREAATFCGGFGAIRRELFIDIGGFDSRQRFMEDVDLGYRLHQAGHRILLCPDIQLTHTKRYTLRGLIRSDVLQRAIPWTRVMLERRVFRNDLNTRSNQVLSVALVCLMIVLPLIPGWPGVALIAAESGLLALLLVINSRFLAFLYRKRGSLFVLRAVPMIVLQYAYSGVGLGLGVLAHLRDRMRITARPERV
ncbi:glycosyltransferase [Elongatibacter sediminis]|uniref:Glycosyltransferase n=1 Tax=Elongatibacter sediminis TaxID=3119006 RepID=A0AAW9RMP5_9GAMM